MIEVIYNWKDPKISNWRKLLRICFLHGWKDIDCRGYGAMEIALDILKKHEKELKPDEREFIKSLFG